MEHLEGHETRTQRQRAWELRCQGMSYPRIAAALGCSVGKAWHLVHRTEDEAHALLADAAAQAKLEHLGQLEAVKERAALGYQETGKPQFLAVLLKTIEMERKVLRLDDERQAYLDERFLRMMWRHEKENEETAQGIAASIEACLRADDEARRLHLDHDTPVGRLCRAIEDERSGAEAHAVLVPPEGDDAPPKAIASPLERLTPDLHPNGPHDTHPTSTPDTPGIAASPSSESDIRTVAAWPPRSPHVPLLP